MRRPTLLLAVLALVGGLTSAPAPAGAQDGNVAGATTTTTPDATTPPTTAADSTTTTAPPAPTTLPPTTRPPSTSAPTTAPPVPPTPPAEGTSTAPKARGVGDSVFKSAENRVRWRLKPEYRPRFVSVLGATIAQMTPTARDMAGNGPAVMVLGLGNPDMAEMDAGLNPYPAATQILGATFNVPCVVWINVKERGVNPYYHQQWRQVASAFNAWLVRASEDGPGNDLYFPRLHVLDWNRAAAAHPGWFLADGLHLNATGQANYARKVDRFVNRVCPP